MYIYDQIVQKGLDNRYKSDVIMSNISLNQRYVARFVIEAETPVAIGTGEVVSMTDQTIATNSKGVPYIPGTALAGVIKQGYLSGRLEDDKFGSDKYRSRIIFSEGEYIGAFNNEENKTLRQHVRIGSNGTAADTAYFDHEALIAGSRFYFEIEYQGQETEIVEDKCFFEALCTKLFSEGLRLGSKTRSGFGFFSVKDCRLRHIDLREDLKIYIDKTSNLNDSFWEKEGVLRINVESKSKQTDNVISVHLKPENFFLFSSGLGDEEDIHLDFVPRKENVLIWKKDGTSELKEMYVIPGSSIKGALLHRTAFHYNLLAGKHQLAEENDAVKSLFGYVDGNKAKAGVVYISDVFVKVRDKRPDEKKLAHVLIDRFTGGAKAGALFFEKVLHNVNFTINITLDRSKIDCKYALEAFDRALEDLKKGILPLGGGVNRGHGTFIEIENNKE